MFICCVKFLDILLILYMLGVLILLVKIVFCKIVMWDIVVLFLFMVVLK